MEFKTVPDFIDYQVSPTGVIKSLKRGKETFLSSGKGKSGYAQVSLSNGKGKPKSFQVHRLVAMLYIPKPKPSQNIVNHIDGNKLNNDVLNLEWTDHRGNMEHYSKKISPGIQKDKSKKQLSEAYARLNTIAYAVENLTDYPKLFQSIVASSIIKTK